MSVLYNENDPAAAEWLRQLIRAGAIAPGVVADCDIQDLDHDYVGRFDQFHAFAGIGVWSHALRLAGVADDFPVWTGSCPCQPFSAAGQRGGTGDPRHLWPQWFRLIGQCRPAIVLGEQVASRDGLGWLDLVHADLEAADYACGAADLCAAGVGAPHIRQRLWWVAQRLADADDAGLEGRRGAAECCEERAAGPGGVAGGLADAAEPRSLPGAQRDVHRRQEGAGPRDAEPERSRSDGGLADAEYVRRDERLAGDAGAAEGTGRACRDVADRHRPSGWPGAADSLWRDADWLWCRDGRWRPVEPGTFPLAHGVAGRVGLLRGYGNALCAPAAKAFIEAALG